MKTETTTEEIKATIKPSIYYISALKMIETPNKDKTPKKELNHLIKNIKRIIKSSIMLGGSSLRDYVNTQGKMGYFQSTFNVYGRDGKKCISKGCSSRITRIVQSNRSTFFCPSCQKK